jgi:integrase
MSIDTTQTANFVSPDENAKSDAVAQLVRIARKNRFDYDDFLYVCQQARRKLGLRKTKRERKLPQLLTEAEIRRFFEAIQRCGDLQHEIMLKLLFFTAVRVSELARIEVRDIDLDASKIFIAEGKEARTGIFCFRPVSGWF